MKIAFEIFSFMQKATNLLEAVGKAERFFVMKASFWAEVSWVFEKLLYRVDNERFRDWDLKVPKLPQFLAQKWCFTLNPIRSQQIRKIVKIYNLHNFGQLIQTSLQSTLLLKSAVLRARAQEIQFASSLSP